MAKGWNLLRVGVATMTATVLCLSLPALGQPREGRPFKGAPPGQRQDFPDRPHRHARDGEERWEKHRRLSPEERRELRRDISEHGRDVYRRRER